MGTDLFGEDVVEKKQKHEMKTKQGYDFFEVASAFQKSIRRGIEKEALYWGCELYSSNYGQYAWKRLLIMLSEDVGIAADRGFVADINGLYQLWQDFAKRYKDRDGDENDLFFVHAVVLMSRVQKSRVVDNAAIYFFHDKDKPHMEIPDYAIDRHTRRGKKMGRGFQHFFDVGGHLENMGDVDGEEAYEIRARRTFKVMPKVESE